MRRRGTISRVAIHPGSEDLTVRLSHFAASLESLAIPPSDPSRLSGRRDWIVRTLRGYVIPRMENPIAPLTVVFAGPTGAGKSTLLNSVAGAEHSVAGPLRPTTKSPLVLASRDLAADYASIGGIECQVVTGRAPILDELTLVDTPDIDSTAVEHRAVAETMIDNADVVVYVNSALRYADLVPWEVLRRAHSRGAPVIHVLNRVKRDSGGTVASYASRLQAEGLGSEVVAIHEQRMARGAQAIPLVTIQALRDRLVDVVEERLAGKADVVRSVLDTMLDHADEVISDVAEMAGGTVEAATAAGIDFDLRRLGAHLARSELDFDLRPIAALAGKRLWVRGRLRRSLPPAASVARNLTLADAALVTAVGADVRTLVPDHEMIGQDEADLLVAQAHSSAVAAVGAWRADLAGLQLTQSSIDQSLAALLLTRVVLYGAEPQTEDVLRVLSGAPEVAGPIARAGELLAERMAPVYDGVDRGLTSKAGRLVASETDIYRARTSLSAIAARSSLANA